MNFTYLAEINNLLILKKLTIKKLSAAATLLISSLTRSNTFEFHIIGLLIKATDPA